MRFTIIFAMAAGALLGGCASLDTPAKRFESLDASLEPILKAGAASPGRIADQPPTARTRPPPLRAQIYPGSGRVIGATPAPAPADPAFIDGPDGVTLNFNDTPIPEVVKTVLGDILGENYSIEPGLGGSVTMATSRPIRRDALIRVLESIVAVHGAGISLSPEGTYRVGPRPLLKGLTPLSSHESNAPGYSIRAVPLRYVSAEAMSKVLTGIVAEDSVLMADSGRNLLVVGGTASQLANAMQAIDTFDVDVLEGMSAGVFPVQHVSVESVTATLEQVFGEDGDTPAAGMFRIIPLEYASRILVLTPQPDYLKTVGTWIRRLDFDDGSAETRLYVYPVQNGDAEHLAELLNDLFDTGEKARAAEPAGDVVPGMLSATMGWPGGGAVGGAGRAAPRAGSGDGGATEQAGAAGRVKPQQAQPGAAGTAAPALTGVRVVADTENNNLLILGDAAAYRVIVNALQRLDIEPLQVLIEAQIVEVSLNDQLEYGMEWFFDNKVNGNTFTIQSQTDSNADLSAQVPGFSWSIANSSDIIRAVFNALAQESLLRVISSPSLLVLDNHTATIQVGDQQPVSVGQATNTSGGGVILESIEFRDTGVNLGVTPRVNASGLVLLEVSQDVTDVGEIDAATGQRTFLQRSLESTIAVQSGDTIVLGGLIRDNTSAGSSGIPFLHRLPGAGWMFGAKEESTDRTELLITITPRVLYNTAEAASISEELRKRLERAVKELTYDSYGSTLIHRSGTKAPDG